MSAVDVQGLISQRRKMIRAQNEMRVHQAHDIKGVKPNDVRCYTYRGVSYCKG